MALAHTYADAHTRISSAEPEKTAIGERRLGYLRMYPALFVYTSHFASVMQLAL